MESVLTGHNVRLCYIDSVGSTQTALKHFGRCNRPLLLKAA